MATLTKTEEAAIERLLNNLDAARLQREYPRMPRAVNQDADGYVSKVLKERLGEADGNQIHLT